VTEYRGWYSYLKTRKGWIPGENTVFIFDEAQVSYKDTQLWNELFKGIHDIPDRRAIAFASYGSPSSFIDIEGTPMFVEPSASVSLLPTAHKDNLPAACGWYFLSSVQSLTSWFRSSIHFQSISSILPSSMQSL
jgi:hypothetical protein